LDPGAISQNRANVIVFDNDPFNIAFFQVGHEFAKDDRVFRVLIGHRKEVE
jgi:hypothetical protein